MSQGCNGLHLHHIPFLDWMIQNASGDKRSPFSFFEGGFYLDGQEKKRAGSQKDPNLSPPCHASKGNPLFYNGAARHCHPDLLHFDPLRVVVSRDQMLVLVPDGSDSLLERLASRVIHGPDHFDESEHERIEHLYC